MVALTDTLPGAEAPKVQTSRKTRKPGEPSPKGPAARVAKSKDAGKTKVSYYLDAQTAEKLAVASIIRRVDQSDLANEILARALSSVAYYEKSPTRTSGEALPVSEIGSDPAGS